MDEDRRIQRRFASMMLPCSSDHVMGVLCGVRFVVFRRVFVFFSVSCFSLVPQSLHLPTSS